MLAQDKTQETGSASTTLEVDDLDLPAALKAAASYSAPRFEYIVTANVDHAIRYHRDVTFRRLYADASLVLLDSRFLANLLRRIRGQHLRSCPGSDLTSQLFEKTIRPGDRVVMVGGSAEQAALLRARYGVTDLVHVDPPMGFIRDPEAVERCLQQIEAASPFRFCFIGIGSPQQEVIGSKLRERGIATGLGLCVGASIDYITGKEERAPEWMQHRGLEWVWRLMQNPRRLAHRYLVRGPQIFRLLPKLHLRPRSSLPERVYASALDDDPKEATET